MFSSHLVVLVLHWCTCSSGELRRPRPSRLFRNIPTIGPADAQILQSCQLTQTFIWHLLLACCRPPHRNNRIRAGHSQWHDLSSPAFPAHCSMHFDSSTFGLPFPYVIPDPFLQECKLYKSYASPKEPRRIPSFITIRHCPLDSQRTHELPSPGHLGD